MKASLLKRLEDLDLFLKAMREEAERQAQEGGSNGNE